MISGMSGDGGGGEKGERVWECGRMGEWEKRRVGEDGGEKMYY